MTMQCLIRVFWPECINFLQALIFIQIQHDVFHYVKAILLFLGQTFASTRVTRTCAVPIPSSTCLLVMVLHRERQTGKANDHNQTRLKNINGIRFHKSDQMSGSRPEWTSQDIHLTLKALIRKHIVSRVTFDSSTWSFRPIKTKVSMFEDIKSTKISNKIQFVPCAILKQKNISRMDYLLQIAWLYHTQ